MVTIVNDYLLAAQEAARKFFDVVYDAKTGKKSA
jgi:hypothetical protein